MTDEQIKHMVDRFLSWRLPDNFSPDAGVSFKAEFNEHTRFPSRHQPMGTNLFDYTQAEAMVRHMVEGPLLPPAPDGATEGWRLVPVEPTPEMVAAAALAPDVTDADRDIAARALCCLPETRHPLANDVLTDIARDYRAMIAVAPSVSPVRPKGEEEADLDYAKDIAKSVAARCFPDSPGFEPLSDMNGVLSQIDNMTCGMVRAPSQPTQTGEEKPIPMILHCPACGLQHVDAPDTHDEAADKMLSSPRVEPWNNPPHRSHLCRPEHGGCGHIWRPADVPTEGVAAITTRGKNDCPPATRKGEENAGLVAEARAMERFYTDRPSVDEQARCPSFEEMSKRECADLAIIFRRLADALASRSPIPGEGRGRDAAEALSEAYFVVTGRSPHWSATFGVDEALTDITDACDMLRLAARTKLGLGK